MSTPTLPAFVVYGSAPAEKAKAVAYVTAPAADTTAKAPPVPIWVFVVGGVLALGLMVYIKKSKGA